MALTQKQQEEWARHIEQFNLHGRDDLANQYKRFRDAGLDYNQIQASGPVDLGQGTTYNPITGRISMAGEQGPAYSYSRTGYGYNDPRYYHGATNYGGFDYTGFYDPNVLNTLTEEDWQSASDTWKSDYESREAGVWDWLESQYYQTNPTQGMSVNIDAFMKDKDVEGSYKAINDQYRNNVLKTAYESALGRYEGEVIDPKQFMQQDWTKYYQDRLNPTTDQNSVIDAIRNNPNLTPEQIAVTLKANFGIETPAAPTAPATAPAPVTAPNTATTGTEYANEMLGPIATTQAPPAATSQNPWSSEFESGIMDAIGGFKTSFDDYLSYLKQPQAGASPSFNLSNMYGDTGQRNSGLMPTTPTSSLPGTTRQSTTGKAGTGSQSLWQ